MPTLTPAHITAPALDEILVEADSRFPNETGGVLLGWTIRGALHVQCAIGPGPDAQHGTHGFHPDSNWQEVRIAEAYRESGRRLSYLGDWHTHPHGLPRPSRLDRATMRTIARHGPARCPEPVMLIVAGAPTAWTLALHQRRSGVLPGGRRVLAVPFTAQ